MGIIFSLVIVDIISAPKQDSNVNRCILFDIIYLIRPYLFGIPTVRKRNGSWYWYKKGIHMIYMGVRIGNDPKYNTLVFKYINTMERG